MNNGEDINGMIFTTHVFENSKTVYQKKNIIIINNLPKHIS